ncbi:zinc finger protein 624-like [Watersipora subatra]|uniref:zinc finger protein 624-like n=1 Tax=Watersipora subatra TaxID=2589382 RepID=UPI00355C334C
MPGDVETQWKIPDNDDGLQLVIEDVRSGVDLLEVNNESSHSATNLPITGDRLVVDGSEIQNPNPQCLPTEDAASTSLSSNPASPKLPPPLENTSSKYLKYKNNWPTERDIIKLLSMLLRYSTSLSSNPASPKVPLSLENTCNSLARHLTSSASERSCESGLTESSIASSNNGRGKPGWKCSQCTMAFVSSSLLVSHVHSTHSDMKAGEMMTCPFCTKNFPTFTQLDDHITKLHGDGSHSCQGCYSVFLRASLLRNHQRSCSAYRKHLQEKKQVSKTGRDTGSKNVCTHCLLSLPDEDALSHHIQQCRTECLSKKYNCEGCLAGYDVLISLFTHQADCTLFSKISSLSSDYSVTLRCQGCNAAHSDLAAFSNHKNECNKVQNLRDRELNEKIQVKQTEICLQPLRNSEDEPVGQSPATNTCYQCLECDRSFANQDLLNKHRQNMHNIVDSCAFKCSGCNVGFSTESALDVHYQLCRQSEPIENLYECPECLTKLEFKSLLEFHKSIHVDPEAKPFKCFGCNGGFTAATHKASHEQKCGKCKLLRQDRARVSTLDKSAFKSSENKGITQTSPSTLPHAQRRLQRMGQNLATV